MALQVKKEIRTGVVLNECYVKVNVGGSKEESVIQADFYANIDSYLKGEKAVATEYYKFVVDVTDNAPNNFKQAYEHLKTLPDYVNAIDLLD